MSLRRKEIRARWRAKNGAHIASYNAAYNATHKEQISAWHKDASNKAKAAERSRAWAAAHPEAMKENLRAFRRRNPGSGNALAAAYKARKKSRQPKWANEFFVAEAYSLATLRSKITGISWHVDHIVPLKSKLVCGLHCEQNLRVIRGSLNCAKGNRVWPDMPKSNEENRSRSVTGNSIALSNADS